MKVLHILKSEPDEMVEILIEAFSGREGATVMALYQQDLSRPGCSAVDWSRLVDDIFSHDRVICWW